MDHERLNGIIGRNLHEESPLNDIVIEACQIFAPSGDARELSVVEQCVLAAVEEGASTGRIAFYRYVDGGTEPATFEDALRDRINVFVVAGRTPAIA